MGSRLLRAFKVRPACAYCGVELSYSEYGSNYATIDHVIPRSRGGRDSLANATVWPSPAFTLADILPQRDCEENYDHADPSE